MLAGVAPIPANSGQVTTRYRLNRYGDRQLNTALHTVVQIRIQYQPATRDYVARRTVKERPAARSNAAWLATVARDLYRLLEGRAATASQSTGASPPRQSPASRVALTDSRHPRRCCWRSGGLRCRATSRPWASGGRASRFIPPESVEAPPRSSTGIAPRPLSCHGSGWPEP